jgi:uncharacterized membrane protein
MPDAESHSHTQRVEAFSDGVFAIAITLLIIEIGVPHVESDESLGDALWHLWPSYGAYALSFISIGIYWVNHHAFLRLFHSTTHVFLMVHVVFLMAIAFLPFPTAVLGEYLKDDVHRQDAVSLYTLGLLLPAIGWFAVWWYGQFRGLLDDSLHPRYVRFANWQYLFSVVVYATAFGISFIEPWVALGLCAVTTGVYIFPPRRPQYLQLPSVGELPGGE